MTAPDSRGPIPFDDALAEVLRRARPLPAEDVPIGESLGRGLAEDVRARNALPPFDGSAADGFAVRTADLAGASPEDPAVLPVIGPIFAGGRPPRVRRRPGPAPDAVAARIFTGAPMPPGTDAVVPQEHVEVRGDGAAFHRPVERGENVRPRGGEYARGETVLRRGAAVSPAAVGLLAAAGRARVRVHRRPRVALVVAGDELRPPGTRLRSGEIWDSNSASLAAALRSAGIEPVSIGRAGDDTRALERTFRRALSAADVVVSAGGVSVGDRDLVKGVLVRLGVREVFWRVAIKPGKPIFFGQLAGSGRRTAKLVYGLPGNPVGALLGFELLVRPALAALAGIAPVPPLLLEAALERGIAKKPGRREFVRAVLSADERGLVASPARGQDSHMLGGLAAANCLVIFPEDRDRLAGGEMVLVRLLPWSLR